MNRLSLRNCARALLVAAILTSSLAGSSPSIAETVSLRCLPTGKNSPDVALLKIDLDSKTMVATLNDRPWKNYADLQIDDNSIIAYDV